MSSGKVWRKPLPGCRLSRRGLSKTITPKDPDQRWRSGSKKQRWELPWALTYWRHGWNRAISVSHFNFSKAFVTVSQEIYRLINLQFPFVVKKINCSEPEGHVKMDRVLVASEALLLNGDEEMKNQTLLKLKYIKALWEDTSTYIIHCHRYRLCP